jgi:hypothetical protein
MPLHIPEAPETATAVVSSTVRAFAESGNFRLPALRSATGPLQVMQSHQVFTLDLTDLVAGRGLQAARPSGWRFLIQDGEKVVAAAETVVTGISAEHLFSGFSEGPFAPSTADAIRTAQRLPDVERGEFELRLLRVPALYFMAVWVYDTGGKGDLLLPLAPAPQGIQAGQAVAATTLLRELASRAEAGAAVGPGDTSGG